MRASTKKDYYEILVRTPALAVAWLALLAPVAAQDSDVSGRITDGQRRPVADVMVAGTQELAAGGPKEVRAKTDTDGNYGLASVGKIIFVRKPGYRPITVNRGATETTLNLELENSDWKVPRCSDRQLREHGRYGDTLLLLAPYSARAKKGRPDADNWRVFLSSPRNRKEKMTIWSGPLLGGGLGHAPEDWYRKASTFSERGDNNYGIIDARGTTAGDLRWRWVSWSTDIVWYHDVSSEAAGFFDTVIETACFRSY